MTEADDSIQTIEHDEKVTAESTLGSDGDLQVRVYLAISGATFIWSTRLDAAAVMGYRIQIGELRKQPQSGEDNTSFLAVAITPAGKSRIAGWNKAQETRPQAKLREALEASTYLKYAVALAYLRSGIEAARVQNAKLAGLACKAGVEELGDIYENPDVLDDTGMKLVLAESTEKNKGIEAAGPIYRGILEARLAIYAEPRRLR